VYGPREKDYFMMAKSIKGHFDTAVGYRHQDITFVYVEDVVQAVFLSLDRAMDGRKYFLSDGNVYTSKDFSDLIHRELGSPWWIRLRVPLFILKAATFIGQRIANMTGKMTPLNDDKYNILKQRNWKCDIEPAIDELGYHPHVKLEEGVRRAMAWYKANKWL
jgi:nucleoside-diphosphate-sugar epimerase